MVQYLQCQLYATHSTGSRYETCSRMSLTLGTCAKGLHCLGCVCLCVTSLHATNSVKQTYLLVLHSKYRFLQDHFFQKLERLSPIFGSLVCAYWHTRDIILCAWHMTRVRQHLGCFNKLVHEVHHIQLYDYTT